MLPEPHQAPTRGAELPGIAPIAGLVRRELPSPEGRAANGTGPVSRAAMPEAPIHEHRPTLTGEDEVRSHLLGRATPTRQPTLPPPTGEPFGPE